MALEIRRRKFLGACSAVFLAAAMPLFVCAVLALSGCDGANPTDEDIPETSTDASGQKLTSIEQLITSDSYAGYLVVHFDESLVVRQTETKTLYSASGEDSSIEAVKNLLAAYPLAELSRSVEHAPEDIDAARARLERLSGKKLLDWNNIYHIKTSTPDEAMELMRELKSLPGVAKVYPGIKGHPSSLATTPSLTAFQNYLLDEPAYGGLNAKAAWDLGVRGEGVYVIDNEPGMNFGHEDLGLIADTFVNGGNFIYSPDCDPVLPQHILDCPPWIAHGTAVAGVLIAKDNGHGVTGFAPDAYYLHSSMSASTYGDLQYSTDGIDLPDRTYDDDVEPGSVWVIEMQITGKFNTNGCGSSSDQYGCVPTELWPEDFAAIQQATALGVTVVSGSGNGQMDLNNEELYTGDWSFAHNLAHEDAGAIMVGASAGANEQKASFSNCGVRVNSFAWGQGVATTGYPYGQYGWTGALPPGADPATFNTEANSFFINNFGGTSSAAAMVGGAAVLVQSHARHELGHRRYIVPGKLRDILVNTGVSQKNGGCNIGKQPRIDSAIAAVDVLIAPIRTELDSGTQLTEERMQALRQMGIGLICRSADKYYSHVSREIDPACPETELWPTGNFIAKDLDFDGDSRADLVQWTNGSWKLDLSGRGSGGDNYGEWDIEVSYPPAPGRWVVPYVVDMNSDGREDFVVYDKEFGKWYVKFTTTQLLQAGRWNGWSMVLDYSVQWRDELEMDPLSCRGREGDNCTKYSRAVPGDYNGDKWVDIAIAGSDGRWYIDFGGPTRSDFGTYDRIIEYLSNDQLNAAPGWAYLAGIFKVVKSSKGYISYKGPDTTPDEGRLVAFHINDTTRDIIASSNIARMFGGNEMILLPGFFGFYNGPDETICFTLKDNYGSWDVSCPLVDSFNFPPFGQKEPTSIYGGSSCRPVVADFDGDTVDDRAVMCPDEWIIAYSRSNEFNSQLSEDGSRRISLEYDTGEFTLPGRPYAGGISYAYVQRLIQLYQESHPNDPPPIPVDMATVEGE